MLLTPSLSCGAEFRRVEPDTTLPNGSKMNSYVDIEGEIQPGDFNKFREFLLNTDNLYSFLNFVLLTSPGGDVVEAMKFANLFDRGFIKVSVAVKCYSSCFIMFAGGVDRSLIGIGTLGVHRISTRELQLDIQRAKAQISPIASDVSAYLLQQGIPRVLVDKMNETPASRLFRIDHESLTDSTIAAAVRYSPIFIDTVDRACGRDPDPFPGKYIREAPRDSQTMAAIGEWVRCSNKVRLRNSYRFLLAELAMLKAGKSSVAFPDGQYERARKSIGE